MKNHPNSPQPPSKSVEWCREQQRAALEHMKPDHMCDHPQCTPGNLVQWLQDSFAEEIELIYRL
jgi:hypothetical protein